tara:strand:- start:101 stop:457 length:357 start_codon:yes stop_codon:yes gene_type:complete
MPDLEVIIFNQKLKLSYQENEKQRLVDAVDKLNKNWDKFSNLHGKVSDKKIITLISLELQDTLVDTKILEDKFYKSEQKVQMLKKELKKNNEEIYNSEIILDELYDEILQIKNNILKN